MAVPVENTVTTGSTRLRLKRTTGSRPQAGVSRGRPDSLTKLFDGPGDQLTEKDEYNYPEGSPGRL